MRDSREVDRDSIARGVCLRRMQHVKSYNCTLPKTAQFIAISMCSKALTLEIGCCPLVAVQNLTPLGQALVLHRPPFAVRLSLLE